MMKIPDSLPWEYDSESGFIDCENQIICQFFSKHEQPFFNCDNHAEYIIKACDMLPELVEMLEVILDDLGGEFNLPQGTIDEIKLLLTKVRED